MMDKLTNYDIDYDIIHSFFEIMHSLTHILHIIRLNLKSRKTHSNYG